MSRIIKSKKWIYRAINQWRPGLVGLFCISVLSACGTASVVSSANPYFELSGNGRPGELVIERVQLDFGSGESSITVEQNTKIRPVATIKYKGAGTFIARWLVDGRVLEQINIMLNRGSVLTLSPKSTTPIPAFSLGQHRLRLEVIKPVVTFKQPEISFFVISSPPGR